ncbi:MAG TPA: VOC family protein [Chthoniobacterales bacterium]|nr:VOC family protein [Chthoniobacterales bacterium]
MNLQAIDHVALSVRDVDASAKWYSDVLGFERQHDDVWEGYPVFVGKNDAAIALFPIRYKKESESTSRPPIRILHFAFRASRSEFLSAQKELKERGIEFEFQDHKISHSIYFSDPDGHELEITTYEAG